MYIGNVYTLYTLLLLCYKRRNELALDKLTYRRLTDEYQLTGGASCKEGRVEVSELFQQPGLVCGEGWGYNQSSVLCRSFGFRYSIYKR